MKHNGFTLTEVLAVLTIIVILAAIAVPSVIGLIEKSKQDVCDRNVLQLEKMYESWLELENGKHSELLFNQFLFSYDEIICPLHGEVRYVDGKVVCNIHSRDGYGDDHHEEEEGVPFL